ncbi:MAG: RNA polymerase sigma factor [Gaiellaceae bacterium]
MEVRDGDEHRRILVDPDSRRWLVQLRSDGAIRDRAQRRLHELLLRIAYTRLLPRRDQLRSDVVDELALDAADHALVLVLGHLDDFRGASRFTTWACQFAVTEVSVVLRRHRRQRRELPVEPETLVLLAGTRSGPERELEQEDLLRRVCTGVNGALTVRQRQVLLALAVDGTSSQVLAASLGTNTGALYKTLHDARCKLRACLAAQGLTPLDEATPGSAPSRGKNSSRPDSYAVGTMGAAT